MKKQPIRCFEGTAKPHEAFWRIRNAEETESGEAEVELYGVISEYSWYEDDITPKMFKDELYKVGKNGPITIRINSGGGDVIAASMMRAIIQDYPGEKTARIDGLAASAAVVVALAADTIKIQDTAYMMIHDPAVVVFLAYLDIKTLDGLSAFLKTIRKGILDTYAIRTGISDDRLKRMMEDETWMSANDAVELGFADEVITGKPAANIQDGIKNLSILKNYGNVPEAILNRIAEPVQTVANEESDEVKRLRDEVRILK